MEGIGFDKDALLKWAKLQYITMREVNNTIPDEVLDYFKDVIYKDICGKEEK